MGTTASTSTENNDKYDNFYEIINDIATNYILTMDFESMKSLAEKEYCDKLVILTGDIIDRYFTDMQVQYLEQKIKGNEEVNDMTEQNVIYFNRDSLDAVDIQNDRMKSIKKKRVCIGIAKYYVKIAHIFAAIVTTINPVYVYKDEATGERIKKKLFEKGDIPKEVHPAIYKVNICDNRIKALKRVSKSDAATDDGETIHDTDDITMHPKICEMNANRVDLGEEPGMAELEKLYLDDEYDYSTGTFRGMSAETERQYRADLRTFYMAFTGETEMPESIQRFSDIKLRQYKTMNGCSGDDPVFSQKQRISKKDKLYIAYANNISSMIDKANRQQKKLLEIINMLFAYVNDPYTDKQKIRINPTLNDTILQKTIVMTRQIIVQLYVGCEQDYVKGVKLYEAIVESQILETTKRQINNLEQRSSSITSSYSPNIHAVGAIAEVNGTPQPRQIGTPFYQISPSSQRDPFQISPSSQRDPFQISPSSQRDPNMPPFQASQRDPNMPPFQASQREPNMPPFQASQREPNMPPFQPPQREPMPPFQQPQRDPNMPPFQPPQRPPQQPQRDSNMPPFQPPQRPPQQPQRDPNMPPFQPPQRPPQQNYGRPISLGIERTINASQPRQPNPFIYENDNTRII